MASRRFDVKEGKWQLQEREWDFPSWRQLFTGSGYTSYTSCPAEPPAREQIAKAGNYPREKNQTAITNLSSSARTEETSDISPENSFSDFNWYPPLLHPKEQIYSGKYPLPENIPCFQHKVKAHKQWLLLPEFCTDPSPQQSAGLPQTGCTEIEQTRNDTSGTLNQAETLLTTEYIDK